MKSIKNIKIPLSEASQQYISGFYQNDFCVSNDINPTNGGGGGQIDPPCSFLALVNNSHYKIF